MENPKTISIQDFDDFVNSEEFKLYIGGSSFNGESYLFFLTKADKENYLNSLPEQEQEPAPNPIVTSVASLTVEEKIQLVESLKTQINQIINE